MAKIDILFDALLENNGSDLHLSVQYPPMLRKKGELVPLTSQSLTKEDIEELIFEIIEAEVIERFKIEKDLDFAYAYENKARFRANYLYKITGPGAVFRVIPSKILTAEQLGLPTACIDLAEKKAGLILVTGPTGSGKSTTLAAMITHINTTRRGHILTIEDPVEFVHQPIQCMITHREIGMDFKTFADAIRSARRENADVILLGELRDAETMRLALQLAGFGILVFATIHTNSAAATIERYVNAFPSSEKAQIGGMLADSLTGIVSQQLLKKADSSGRVAAHEILFCTHAASAAIRESKTNMLKNVIQSGAKMGMQTMDGCLEKLMNQNTISPMDALEKAVDKNSFMKLPKVVEALSEKNIQLS